MKIFNKISLLLVLILGITSFASAQGIELRRQKNVATRIVFPIRNSSTGATITGATGLDSECTTWADGSNPSSYADCTNEATELGTSGFYYLQLTAAEVNADYASVIVKSTSTNAITPIIQVNTKHGTVFADASGNLSGSIGSLSTQAKTDVNTEVANQLNTAIPGSPTADSINARIKSMSDSTGTFQSGSTTTQLNLAAGETANDVAGQLICIDSGVASKDCGRITIYNTSTKVATVSPALTNAPASGDKYTIIGDTDATVSTSQIRTAVWDADRASYTVAGSFGQGVASVQGNVTGSVAAVTGSVGSVTGAVGSVTAGVTVTTNNDKTNYGLSSTALTAVENQIWNAARSGHTTAGTFGQGVIVNTNSDKTGYSIAGTKTTLDALNDVSSATVLSQATSALNTYDAPTKAEMDAAFTEIKGTGWSSSTDTLRQIALGGGGGGGSCNNAAIADAVWDELLSGHTTTGSAGAILAQSVNTVLTCQAVRQNP